MLGGFLPFLKRDYRVAEVQVDETLVLRSNGRTTVRRKAVLKARTTGLEAVAATFIFAIKESHEFRRAVPMIILRRNTDRNISSPYLAFREFRTMRDLQEDGTYCWPHPIEGGRLGSHKAGHSAASTWQSKHRSKTGRCGP